MNVIVLAGGEGSRIPEVTQYFPKQLLPYKGNTIIEHITDEFRCKPYDDVCICISSKNKSSYLENYYLHKDFNYTIKSNVVFSTEDKPLGTAGCVLKATEQYPWLGNGYLIVFNGDVYNSGVHDFIGQAMELMDEASDQVECVIALKEMKDEVGEYGTVTLDDKGYVTSFNEKVPSKEEVLVSRGIYVFQKDILTVLKVLRMQIDKDKFMFETDVFPTLVDCNALKGIVVKGEFRDFGTPARLLEAYRK